MSRRWSGHQKSQQGGPWPGWFPQWPKSKGKGNKADKPAQEMANPKPKDGLPLSYASVPVSKSEAVEDQGAQAFMTAFLKVYQEGGTPIPDALQHFLPDQEREEMKSQQKMLNRMRNVKQKISNKEKAIVKDEVQWKTWLEEVRQVIEKQKQQHEETQERLHQELKSLQLEEEKLRSQKVTDVMEVSEDESMETKPAVEDMDSLLGKAKAKEEPQANPTEEDLQQQMNQKLQDMQLKLQQDFQQKLRLAEEMMAHRYQAQLQKHTQEPQVISLLDELDGQDAEAGAAGYGANRPKTKSESSPYRKEVAKSMAEKLKQSHGMVPTGNG